MKQKLIKIKEILVASMPKESEEELRIYVFSTSSGSSSGGSSYFSNSSGSSSFNSGTRVNNGYTGWVRMEDSVVTSEKFKTYKYYDNNGTTGSVEVLIDFKNCVIDEYNRYYVNGNPTNLTIGKGNVDNNIYECALNYTKQIGNQIINGSAKLFGWDTNRNGYIELEELSYYTEDDPLNIIDKNDLWFPSELANPELIKQG